MNANAISKPSYSAAVNAIPQSCASLPLFFLLVMHLPRRPPPAWTRPGRRTACYNRSELRTIGDQTHPLFVLLLFYSTFYSVAASIFRLFLFLLHLLFLLLVSLVSLVSERTCETKGFSSRYTKPLELLNPPLAAFSSFPV